MFERCPRGQNSGHGPKKNSGRGGMRTAWMEHCVESKSVGMGVLRRTLAPSSLTSSVAESFSVLATALQNSSAVALPRRLRMRWNPHKISRSMSASSENHTRDVQCRRAQVAAAARGGRKEAAVALTSLTFADFVGGLVRLLSEECVAAARRGRGSSAGVHSAQRARGARLSEAP